MTTVQDGRAELTSALRAARRHIGLVGLFSLVLSGLALTGPLYMLQVYDGVLPGRSAAALVMLTGLMLALFALLTVVETSRARILARIGARFQAHLDLRAFAAGLQSGAGGPADVEAVRRLLASPAIGAVFDLPSTLLFAAGLAAVHPWLGLLAIAGAASLACVTALAHRLTASAAGAAARAELGAQRFAAQIAADLASLTALGMATRLADRWAARRREALGLALRATDTAALYAALSHGLRLALQSAMLGLGAWLVLAGSLSPSAMVAASILFGRGLAPIEVAIGQWPVIQRGLAGWRALAETLSAVPAGPVRRPLPRPDALLETSDLTVVPPGAQRASVRLVSLRVSAGEVLAVTGPSGAGKSTLLRALAGAWPPAGGSIRLGGVGLPYYDRAELGGYLGYLPQQPRLCEGTIAQNIARFLDAPPRDAIEDAARRAGAHDMILALPQGYDSAIGPEGPALSGGQVQRIALARALFGDPAVLLLDEPATHLDRDGIEALRRAVSGFARSGGAVIFAAHAGFNALPCTGEIALANGARQPAPPVLPPGQRAGGIP
jgi:ATP-binding cassette subfamily C protein